MSFTPMPEPRPEAWRRAGAPDHIVQIMAEGADVESYSSGLDDAPPTERAQYAWRDAEHFIRGVDECDRAILAGHLELVPADEVESSLARAPAHPWTVVLQHGDKWRAAQDYSQWTNLSVGSKPFTMPTVWDAAAVLNAQVGLIHGQVRLA